MTRGTIGTPGAPEFRTYEPLARFTNLTLNGSDVLSGVINNALRSLRDTGGGFLVLPASDDYGILGEPIVLQNRTGIIGNGFRATRLYLADGSNCDMILNYVSSDDVEANAFSCMVRDIGLNGNSANQTAGSADEANGGATGRDGIFFSSSPTSTTQATQDDDFDSNQFIQNVWINDCAGNGFTGHGRSEMLLQGVTAVDCEGYGFRPAFDTRMVACVAGRNRQSGFYFKDRSSIRVTGCKSFWSGHASDDPPAGHGFHLNNSYGIKITGCEAQDNYGSGFLLENTSGGSVIVGCTADSNSKDTAGALPAVDMWNSDDNVIEVSCFERAAYGSDKQQNALRIRNGSARNTIRLRHFGAGGTVGRAVTSDSTATYGNDITINNESGTQNVGYVATPYTPNPYDGGTVVMGIEGNTTINPPAAGNAHSGTRMRFLIYQDGTGGHTVTFDSDYQLNGGTFTAATSPFAMSVIEFMYDDGDDLWYETSRSVA